jgi:acyl-CoA synthetase (AMP-forming)/AMP-acid ligase II
VELLAARAAADPDRVAVIVPGHGALTFGGWESRASSVAAGLRNRDVRPGDRVGLVFSDHDWVDYSAAYCGVQKAGGVAVPLLAGLGPAEQARLLEMCGASFVLRGEGTALPRWTASPTGTLRDLDEGQPERVDVDVRPDHLAQIIFTSGTTGRPKGVAATHANLTLGLRRNPRHRSLAHSRHFLHAYPIGTNAAQATLVTMLSAAAAALVAPRFDAETFGRLIEHYRVGSVFLVPAMAAELVNAGVQDRRDLSSVVLVNSTGAALPAPVAAGLAEVFPNATVLNQYTSTEASPAQTTMVYDPERPHAVGRAHPSELMIADEAGRPVGAGELGDVWLRTPSAPRFYFEDPAASAEVFTRGWTRMGDLGCLDAEGYLYLRDRSDDLIKTGAFKVSTLAVEAVLYDHPAVADAAVIGLPHPVMGAMVAAAVVLKPPATLPDLRVDLVQRLPRHELPTRLLAVETLPRNAGGKVLKRELRAMFEAASADPSAVPSTTTEISLSRLWRKVLSVPNAGANDDFFVLGGDSLRATQLTTLVAECFGVTMATSVVFDRPLLSSQAEWIDLVAASVDPGTDQGANGPAEIANASPGLSASQEENLRWMYETSPPRDGGRVFTAVRIRAALDVLALRQSLAEIIRRHEPLRTTFTLRNGLIVGVGQASDAQADRMAEVIEVSAQGHNAGEREEHARALAVEERMRPSDLTSDALVRALVIRLGPREHVLVTSVHHFVFDGESVGVFLRELAIVYSAFRAGADSPLPPLPMSYRDYCAWTRAQWARTRPFWEAGLAGAPTDLTPFPGRRATSHCVRRWHHFIVESPLATQLRGLAQASGASVFMAMAAWWTAVLAQWTGNRDLVLMSFVPGRTRPEHEALIGWLAQSLLLRIDAQGDPTFTELLARARKVTLEALDNQYYPSAEFAARVPYPTWLMYGSWGEGAHFGGLESEPFPLPHEAGLDWPAPAGELNLRGPELEINERPDGSLASAMVYNVHAFDEHTIAGLTESFLAFGRRAVANPDTPIAALATG